ncbi:TPA: hypothetical protein I7767_01965 [Vibrio vulnificus]|nr:hypothetical protein [Vibrio vulnificus]
MRIYKVTTANENKLCKQIVINGLDLMLENDEYSDGVAWFCIIMHHCALFATLICYALVSLENVIRM